jgi:gluconolactonase
VSGGGGEEKDPRGEVSWFVENSTAPHERSVPQTDTRPLVVLVLVIVLALAAALPAQRGAPRQFELRAESPRFNDLIAAGATLEKVAGGFGFTEGPVWSAAGGFLYVNDEQQNRIARVYPDGRVETVLEIRDPDGAAYDTNHRLIVCLSTLRKLIAVEPDGRYSVLVETYQGKRLNSVNDVVLGPDGALYFTDPTIDLPRGEAQELPTAVYRLGWGFSEVRINDDGTHNRLPPGAALTQMATDLAQPNGLAFSPDGRHLYVDDTERREIRVYDPIPYAAPPGRGSMTVWPERAPITSLANSRVFAKEEGTGGVPDGMKVDVNGNLYVTGPLGVWVWDPEGHHLGTIVLPEQPANLAWGDADDSTLYFTARTSVYRLKTKTKGFVRR